MTELLAAEELTVGRRAPLLRSVRLTVLPGEAWFLLGRNGSGKSTLLATLLGLLRPLAGRVRLGPGVADRQRLGYVPQVQQMFASLPMSVRELVALGLSGRRLDAATRDARVRAALEQLRIVDLARQTWDRLSVGQRRRALAARALAREPALLLLDEPTSNLDPHAARQLVADLDRHRRDRGLGILHATHDLALATAFATHVALVHDGRVTTGPAAELLRSPALRAELGS